MQSPNDKVRDISAHRVQLCMLALDKLQGHWPPLAWNYRLFKRVLEIIQDKIGRNSSHSLSVTEFTTQAVDSFPAMPFSLDSLLVDSELIDSLPFQENPSEPQNYSFFEDTT